MDQPENEAAALARLKRMLGGNAKPELTEDEYADLLRLSRRQDQYGASPSDTGWIYTVDLHIGAAAGFRWKAAKVAGKFDLKAGDTSLTRSQMHKQLILSAEYHESQVSPVESLEELYIDPVWVLNR